MKRLLLILLTLFALASPSLADAQTQIINPRRGADGFRIGPYPIPLDDEGDTIGYIYTSLIFVPEIQGRGAGPFVLRMHAMAQLTDMGAAIERLAERRLSQDNCGRVNAVDNWVYDVSNTTVEVPDPSRLRIKARVSVSTWACTEGVPETVCETYTDSFGISWPYNCVWRPTRYKTVLLQQGGEAEQEILFRVSQGVVEYKIFDPVLTPDNNTVLQNLFNGALRHFLHTDEALQNNAVFTPDRWQAPIPSEYEFLHPTIERAGFETIQGQPFVYSTFSVSVTADQINDFMSQYFGSLWTPIQPAPVANSGPTKRSVQADCVGYLAQNPGHTIYQCAAAMGLPYDELPD